ncbi:autotransporter-associated beta strand repeat-containing protein, partial [Gallibacterium anatis]|uniref:autotransporter-associated beta strand repeat-containing protein n=1 Tax=Gallibacterium anatis TaxID=750 RepID=UPI000805F8F6
MNKIYRVIWNAAKGVWQCVSEFAIAKGKSKSQSISDSKTGDVKKNRILRWFALSSLVSYLALVASGASANVYNIDREINTRVVDPNQDPTTTPHNWLTAIGRDKKTVITIKNGGEFIAKYDLQIVQLTSATGLNSGAKGSKIVVTDGGKLFVEGGWLDVGSGNQGFLDIVRGGQVIIKNNADIGSNSSSEFSKLTVDGSGSSLWVNKDLVVGDSNRGYGQLDIKSGGKIDVGSLITSGANAVGEVYVDNGTITITDPSKILFDKMDTSTQDKQDKIEIQSGGATLVLNGTSAKYTQFDKAAISGAGALTKQGDGNLILTADNTYSGATNVTQGTLQLGNGSATGKAGSGEIALSGGTTLALDHGSNDFTLDNAISGNGKISQLTNNTGTTIVTNNNTGFTGDVEIQGGTLQVGNGSTSGDIGKGNVTVNSGANLQINHSDSYTLDNTVTGGGNLIQAGNGTTIVTKDNTYTGTTTVSVGTLQVGNNNTTGDIGTGDVTVNSGATLKISHSDDYTLDNNVTGAGNLEQAGSGKTSLDTGKNYNYTGKTTVSNGELDIVSGASINGTSEVSIGSDKMYSAEAADQGQAKLTVNGTLTTAKSGDDSGDVVLTHGQLTVNGNATVGNIKSTTDSDDKLATVNVTKGGVLTTNLINGDVLFQNFKTAPAPDTVTVDGTWNANVVSGIVNQETGAAFSGSGTLNKEGSGKLALNADNTIGNTNIKDGEISVNTGKSLAITNNLTVGDGKEATGSAKLTNNGTVTVKTATVKGVDGQIDTSGTLNITNALTVDGGVVNSTGNTTASTLTVDNKGAVNVNGGKTTTSTTTVNDGVVAVGTAGALAGGVVTVGNGTGDAGSAKIDNKGTMTADKVTVKGPDGQVDTSGTLTIANDLAVDGGAVNVTGGKTTASTTTVNDGTVAVGTAGELSGGAVTVGDWTGDVGSAKIDNKGTMTADSIIVNRDGELDNAKDLTVKGELNAAGGVVNSTGNTTVDTLTVAVRGVVNVNSGKTTATTTTVKDGTIAVGTAGELVGGEVIVGDGTGDSSAKLDNKGTMTADKVTVKGPDGQVDTSGTLTITNNLTVDGGAVNVNGGKTTANTTTVNDGTVTVGTAGELAGGAVTVGNEEGDAGSAKINNKGTMSADSV